MNQRCEEKAARMRRAAAMAGRSSRCPRRRPLPSAAKRKPSVNTTAPPAMKPSHEPTALPLASVKSPCTSTVTPKRMRTAAPAR